MLWFLRSHFVGGVLLACLFSGPAHAIVLLTDNFDTENAGTGTVNYVSFAHWTVTDGSVDLLGPGLVDFLPGQGIYVDLDGTTSNGARLESQSAFSFDPGSDITLSFALAGPCLTGLTECGTFPGLNQGPNTVTVSLGGLYVESFTRNFDDPLEQIVRTFSASAAVMDERLVFDHNGGDNIGLILDDVELRAVAPTSIPILNTALLLLMGIASLGVQARKSAPRRGRRVLSG